MPGDPLLAGVDAGTTRIRALIFTTEGQPIAEGSRPTEVRRPRPGWAEHDPGALWQATCDALHDALGQIDHPHVVGIAVASVGEAFVPLDRHGQPTGPTIAWYDERPTRQLEWLSQAIGVDHLHALTGLAPDPTFSLCKLLWLKDNEPDALARTTLWLNVAHYLAWRLCGVPTSDLSLASRSLALDLQRRGWAEDLIREVGLAPAAFAPIRPAGARLGEVTAEGAAASGLPEGCAVGVGGHDHIVGALAVHGLETGVLFDSMGSAEALTLALDRPDRDGALARRGFSQGVVEVSAPIHYAFGGLPTSGACIEWFRQLFAREPGHEQLIAEAESVAPGCDGATFLPDLRGRISPLPDPLARGAWFGLSADASCATLYRAVLEGLAFDARLCLDALTEIPGLPAIRTVRAIGGNTRNGLLMRIKASTYARPIAAAEMPEATALGAALLAGVASGAFSDLRSVARGQAARFRSIEPEPGWAARYEAQYREVYRPAYAALRPLHHAARRLADPS